MLNEIGGKKTGFDNSWKARNSIHQFSSNVKGVCFVTKIRHILLQLLEIRQAEVELKLTQAEAVRLQIEGSFQTWK